MVFLHNAHLITIILFNIYVVRYKTIPSRKIEGGNNRVILATDGESNKKTYILTYILLNKD